MESERPFTLRGVKGETISAGGKGGKIRRRRNGDIQNIGNSESIFGPGIETALLRGEVELERGSQIRGSITFIIVYGQEGRPYRICTARKLQQARPQ